MGEGVFFPGQRGGEICSPAGLRGPVPPAPSQWSCPRAEPPRREEQAPLREGPAWPFRADCRVLCPTGRPATGCHQSRGQATAGLSGADRAWGPQHWPSVSLGWGSCLVAKATALFCGPGRGEHGSSLWGSHWVWSFVSAKWELSH